MKTVPRRTYVVDWTDADGRRRRLKFASKRAATLELAHQKATALETKAARLRAQAAAYLAGLNSKRAVA